MHPPTRRCVSGSIGIMTLPKDGASPARPRAEEGGGRGCSYGSDSHSPEYVSASDKSLMSCSIHDAWEREEEEEVGVSS